MARQSQMTLVASHSVVMPPTNLWLDAQPQSPSVPPLKFMVRTDPSAELDLAAELRMLRAEIHELAQAVQALRVRLEPTTFTPGDCDQATAKAKIAAYLQTHGQAYPSDISDDLALDYDRVLDILGELQGEGRIVFPSSEAPRDAS